VPWFGGRGMDDVATSDNGIRPDTSLEQLAKLRPVFDRRYGSVTAGNSSPLTDGAAAVLLMGDDTARALGYRPLAYLRSYAVAAVDPSWQLLMGPVYAVPKALERAGIAWEDVGLVEIHEAFASQVLSNTEAWASPRWAERLGLHEPVGEVDWSRTNVMGGSIAIGHPFGATGARLVTQLANEMRRRNTEFGLISICAQGGMAHALVLEAA
jgi:acetyl-CoA acyltransferase